MDSTLRHGLPREGGWRYSRPDAQKLPSTFTSEYTHPSEYHTQYSSGEHAAPEAEEHNRQGISRPRVKTSTFSQLKLWRLDILAILLAIGLVVGIFLLLDAYNGRQISTWTEPITLTAAAAILSAANAAALAKVASSVISQEKWAWFWSLEANPRVMGPPLKDMDRFDEASRGPWGAILLLKTGVKKPALLIPLVVTVFAVAMGPFVQQAVRPVQCEFEVEDDTATIPKLQSLYSTNGFRAWGQFGMFLPSTKRIPRRQLLSYSTKSKLRVQLATELYSLG